MAHVITGTVVSDKAAKTIVVAVETRKMHPIYKKQYKVTNRYTAHDEQNVARVGDSVQIESCRPLSATKRWMLKSVVAKAGTEQLQAEAEAQEATAEKEAA